MDTYIKPQYCELIVDNNCNFRYRAYFNEPSVIRPESGWAGLQAKLVDIKYSPTDQIEDDVYVIKELKVFDPSKQ